MLSMSRSSLWVARPNEVVTGLPAARRRRRAAALRRAGLRRRRRAALRRAALRLARQLGRVVVVPSLKALEPSYCHQ